MVTIRSFWTPAEAALAKSVLDNYEIRSALLNENSNLYVEGGQVAVPTRLVVDEADATRAALILNGDFDKAADLELAEDAGEIESGELPAPEVAERNPWELLVLAFYFLLPAVCFLFVRFPKNVSDAWARYYAPRATVIEFLGWLGVTSSVLLVGLYLLIRYSSRKSQPAK